tara:strand:+ start:411 stop:584 length:174 start_codon:yes stop_codon:yes gene_type:complete
MNEEQVNGEEIVTLKDHELTIRDRLELCAAIIGVRLLLIAAAIDIALISLIVYLLVY